MTDDQIVQQSSYGEDENVLTEAFGDDIDRLNRDIDDTDDIEEELDKLINASLAIESFGISPTSMAIMQSTHLLAGTSLEALAVESLSHETPDSPEAQLAVESLGSKISEKMTQWSAKILEVTKSASDRILSLLNVLWSKISTFTKKLTNKTWDAAKITGRAIKAHPYRTVAALVAAAAAVAGIVIFVGSNAPMFEADEGVVTSFVTKVKDMINRIHLPFNKSVYAEVRVNGGPRLYCVVENTFPEIEKSSTTATLGWGKTAVKSISGQIGKILTMTKTGAVNVSNRIYDFMEKTQAPERFVANTAFDIGTRFSGGSKLAGHFLKKYSVKVFKGIMFAVTAVVFKLITTIVLAALRMVRDTFGSLLMMVDREPATA